MILIIEIALGIVVAVIILNFLPEILGAIGITLAAVIALAAAGLLIYGLIYSQDVRAIFVVAVFLAVGGIFCRWVYDSNRRYWESLARPVEERFRIGFGDFADLLLILVFFFVITLWGLIEWLAAKTVRDSTLLFFPYYLLAIGIAALLQYFKGRKTYAATHVEKTISSTKDSKEESSLYHFRSDKKTMIAIVLVICIALGYHFASSDKSQSVPQPPPQLAHSDSTNQHEPSAPLDEATSKVLAASVQSALPQADGDRAPRSSAFQSKLEETEWLAAMSPRLKVRVPDDDNRLDLLKSVHYEATRAGLDPQLVLGMIDVLSNFDKMKTGKDGRLGYMQVHPRWVLQIGKKGDNLLNLRTNLRYGCVILRHYVDLESGNLFRALNRYQLHLPGNTVYYSTFFDDPAFPGEVVSRWKSQWKYEG
ncbi:MAG: lytic transglycosylase domain-containing protein [Betaproteobacteria bacterium]